MKNHLLVAAAFAAATFAAGCGHGVTPQGLGKGTAGATAQKTIINKPSADKLAPKLPTLPDDVAIESIWNGNVGGQSAHISLMGAGFVDASVGRNRFNGSNFGSSCSGSLRRADGGVDTVHLSAFSQSVTGRIGRDSAMATVSQGGWVTGRVGQRQIRLTVNHGMVTGSVGIHNVFLGGTGMEPGEGLGMTAALLVLAAAAE